jgi:hypothetical protein
MWKQAKTLLVLAAVTVMLGALVGGASAGRLSTSSRNIRATWASMEFGLTPLGPGVRCPVTFEGSLHSAAIAKVIGALVGHLSRATVNNAACTGGRVTILQASLPWHVHYDGFQGTLPNIAVVRTWIDGMAYEVTFGEGCLFVTSQTQPLGMDLNRSTATRALTSASLHGQIASANGCVFGSRPTLAVEGTSASLTQLGGTGAISVTLI